MVVKYKGIVEFNNRPPRASTSQSGIILHEYKAIRKQKKRRKKRIYKTSLLLESCPEKPERCWQTFSLLDRVRFHSLFYAKSLLQTKNQPIARVVWHEIDFGSLHRVKLMKSLADTLTLHEKPIPTALIPTAIFQQQLLKKITVLYSSCPRSIARYRACKSPSTPTR